MRNRVLDAAKAVAAYFVVLLHIRFPGRTGEIVNVLARFAVPFFFLISGYFCYSREEGKTRARLPGKIRHTLLLCGLAFSFYLIWEGIWVCIDGKTWKQWISGIFTVENLEEFLRYNNSSFLRWHLWFLPALLYCYLLMLAVETFHLHRLAYLMIPVLFLRHFWMEEAAVFTGVVYRTMEFRNYLYTGFPFFMLGYLIHEKEESWKNWLMKKRCRSWYPAAGIFLGAVGSVAEYTKTGLLELFVGSFVMAVSLFVFCITNKGIATPRWLERVGSRYAFSIYLLHLAVGDFCKEISLLVGVNQAGWYLWTRPLLVCILTTLVSMLLFWIYDLFYRTLFISGKMWYSNKC